MARILERWYPFLGGLLATAVYLGVPQFRQYVFPETLPNLLSAVLTVGGVALGFLATIESLLLTIDDKPIVRRIKDAGLYSQVLEYLRAAFFWSFALTILSTVALLFDYKDLKSWTIWHVGGTALWLGVAVAGTLSYYRISSIWQKILKNIDVKHP